MKPQNPEPDESHNCERCGAYGAVEMGDQQFCPDCLQATCSCCPEFEKEESPAGSPMTHPDRN